MVSQTGGLDYVSPVYGCDFQTRFEFAAKMVVVGKLRSRLIER